MSSLMMSQNKNRDLSASLLTAEESLKLREKRELPSSLASY
jgi:hypothetical protein